MGFDSARGGFPQRQSANNHPESEPKSELAIIDVQQVAQSFAITPEQATELLWHGLDSLITHSVVSELKASKFPSEIHRTDTQLTPIQTGKRGSKNFAIFFDKEQLRELLGFAQDDSGREYFQMKLVRKDVDYYIGIDNFADQQVESQGKAALPVVIDSSPVPLTKTSFEYGVYNSDNKLVQSFLLRD